MNFGRVMKTAMFSLGAVLTLGVSVDSYAASSLKKLNLEVAHLTTFQVYSQTNTFGIQHQDILSQHKMSLGQPRIRLNSESDNNKVQNIAQTDVKLMGNQPTNYQNNRGLKARQVMPLTQSQGVKNNTISFKGQTIAVKNAQGAQIAPTDGKAGYFQGDGSTTDGKTTHIIGHNPGVFTEVLALKVGDQIQVVDGNGNQRSYTVYWVSEMNDGGNDPAGNEQWTKILGQKGESISLQTCIDSYWNYMVMAH